MSTLALLWIMAYYGAGLVVESLAWMYFLRILDVKFPDLPRGQLEAPEIVLIVLGAGIWPVLLVHHAVFFWGERKFLREAIYRA